MAHITLKPGPMELGLHREQYDELVQAIEEEGHDVELEEPIERRSVPGADLGAEAYALIVQVAGFVDDHLLEMIVNAL